MKKREFSKKAAEIVMNRIAANWADFNTRLNLKIDISNYSTYFNIRLDGNLWKINVYQNGNITYRIWDCLGNTTNDYIHFYDYFKEDDHVDVLKKLEADMGRLIDLFCKIETFHDFTGIDIGYYKDNEKKLEEYSKMMGVCM